MKHSYRNYRTNYSLYTTPYESNMIAIEEDGLEVGNTTAVRASLDLFHVFKHHVYEVSGKVQSYFRHFCYKWTILYYFQP